MLNSMRQEKQRGGSVSFPGKVDPSKSRLFNTIWASVAAKPKAITNWGKHDIAPGSQYLQE